MILNESDICCSAANSTKSVIPTRYQFGTTCMTERSWPWYNEGSYSTHDQNDLLAVCIYNEAETAYVYWYTIHAYVTTKMQPWKIANYTQMHSHNTKQNHTILLEPSDSLYRHPHSDLNVHANIPQHTLICKQHADIIIRTCPWCEWKFSAQPHLIHLVARRTPTRLLKVLCLPYWLSCCSAIEPRDRTA